MIFCHIFVFILYLFTLHKWTTLSTLQNHERIIQIVLQFLLFPHFHKLHALSAGTRQKYRILMTTVICHHAILYKLGSWIVPGNALVKSTNICQKRVSNLEYHIQIKLRWYHVCINKDFLKKSNKGI